MTLPPWLRAIQQTWTFHIVQAAAVGAGVAAFACFATANDFTWACARTGLIAGGGALFLSAQHSPGSSSFVQQGPRAGEVNQPVAQVVKMQAEAIPVKVVAASK